ncbi:MAG: c-type cytochrome domain-containing protein, partial [Planctomycetota bacterium]
MLVHFLLGFDSLFAAAQRQDRRSAADRDYQTTRRQHTAAAVQRYLSHTQLVCIAIWTALFSQVTLLERAAQADRTLTDERLSYAMEVQPLLARYCFECHGQDRQEADLRLDT